MGGVAWLDKDVVVCCYEGVMSCLEEGMVACLDNNNKDHFDFDFSLYTPFNSFLREPWVGDV